MELVGVLTVTRVRSLTPRMVRVSFTAPDGFEPWPDQQLKLCFPRGGELRLPPSDGDDMRWYQAFPGDPEESRPWMRGFTVRAHDPARAEIDIDFVLHGDGRSGRPLGPHGGRRARCWAATARPGSTRRPLPPGDWHLFAGDETALPAIGSLLESLPASARPVVFAEVADPAEEQPLPGRPEVHWLHRSRGESLVDAVRAASFPPGAVSAWLAGEASAVRSLRRHLVDERGGPEAVDRVRRLLAPHPHPGRRPDRRGPGGSTGKLAQARGEV